MEFLFFVPKIFILGLAGELSECGGSIQAFNWVMLGFLAAGTVFAFRSPDRRLFLFLISPFLSNLWVAANLWRLPGPAPLIFLVAHLGLFIFLIVRLRGHRLAAGLFSVFFMGYALTAGVIGSYQSDDSAHMFEDDRHPPPDCMKHYLSLFP